MKSRDDLEKRLNLMYLHYANMTTAVGPMDLPALYCRTEIYPDFLALYSEKSLYHATQNTCVCFYQYDDVFDGKNGLFQAIYYNNEERLSYFRKRFEGVRFFISPDYSTLGDIHRIENLYRLFKARIVAIWLAVEPGAVVIPNISVPEDHYIEAALTGLEQCSVVAISTKGHMKEPEENARLRHIIRKIVDMLPLKAMIVYDVCGTNQAASATMSYATEHGIKTIIPDNTLKLQNARQHFRRKRIFSRKISCRN